MTDDPPLIEMRGIEKRFGRIEALRGVDLVLRDTEILGLLGDNGSGKSTLIKVLIGLHEPNAGKIRIRGEEIDINNPKAARQKGIATVYQDLALVDEQTVAENIFLGRYPTKTAGVIPYIDYERMEDESERILSERLNIDIDPTSRVEFLSGGERQAVAIARALVTDPDIVIMDEPTSALSADSAERVQRLIETLRDEGVSVILISHDLNEIFSLTDRITVLDNGNQIGTIDTDKAAKDDVVRMMVEGAMPDHLHEHAELTDTDRADA